MKKITKIKKIVLFNNHNIVLKKLYKELLFAISITALSTLINFLSTIEVPIEYIGVTLILKATLSATLKSVQTYDKKRDK